jgi:hypothetical protein
MVYAEHSFTIYLLKLSLFGDILKNKRGASAGASSLIIELQ